MNDIQKAILNAVDKLVEDKLKKAKFSYYIDGEITAVVGEKYTVVSGNSTYTNLPARTGVTYEVGDLVQICVKNGDSSRKFIDDKKLI